MHAVTIDVRACIFALLALTACDSNPPSQTPSKSIGGNSNTRVASEIASLDNDALIELFSRDASHESYSAFDAIAELQRRGENAIEALLGHLEDDRESVTMFRVTRSSVGDVCFYTLSDMVAPTPDDYTHSWGRTRVDGENHERPHHLHRTVFNRDNVRAWFAERNEHSLVELQIEGLEWWIDAESEIGFPTEDARRGILGPLKRELSRLKAQKQNNQAGA